MGSRGQPDYGKRLIPQILDSLAVSDPDRIIFSYAKSPDLSAGLVDVSAAQFEQAVNKTAWWILQQAGLSKRKETVGYIGPHDLRHVLLTYACAKTGYQPLFLSPKNSSEGALSVLEATECNIWVQAQEQPCLLDFIHKRPMKTLDMPLLDELLDVSAGVEPFPYTKTWEEAKDDCFCLLHSSGSTGLPKPIKWTHALIGTMDAVRLLPQVDGDDGMLPWTHGWDEKDRIYSSFPMSHGAGLIMDILMPSLFALHCVLGPPGVLPNMGLIESLADNAAIDIWSMVPSMVDELGESPDVLAKFKHSKFICASGGPVTPAIASKVNDVIRVLNLTGTSEGLFIGNLWVDRVDWHYFAFHPWSCFEFKEVEPGVYEHWAHRDEVRRELFQGLFITFPDKQSINLKDLYTKHPTKPNLYAYKGRNDDIVVLGNGYKISPQSSEARITMHPAVSGCLIVGTGKLQAAVLIELSDPSSSAMEDPELLNSIWCIVQECNASSMHKNQLHRDYIMFAEPDKPFIRTDKRTIKRHDTLKLYASYIDAFYEQRELAPDLNLSVDVDPASTDSVKSAIRQILGSIAPKIRDAPDDADLFNLGLDSLLAFHLVRSLRGAMGLQDQLAPRHLYANSTIATFAAAVVKVAMGRSGLDGGKDSEEVAQMMYLFDKYKLRLSTNLNTIDNMMPRLWVRVMLYIPLREGVTFQKSFSVLQQGLSRLLYLMPSMDGRLTDVPEDAANRPGKLFIDRPPPEHDRENETNGAETHGPRQLVFRDLSKDLPNFEYLRSKQFTTLFKDEAIFNAPWFPERPCDLFYSQANFIKGGCLLATGFQHTCWDGTGIVITLRALAECCRYVQGDLSASCSWLHPQSMNRNLLHSIWQQEGLAKTPEEVDPEIWGYLGYRAPPGLTHAGPTDRWTSPTEPPSKQVRSLECRTFYLPPESVHKLEAEVVTAEPEAKGRVNTADVIQAIYWRAVIRARYRAQVECHSRTFGPGDESMLELPIDGRPFFSDLLPDSYAANLLVINRLSMTVAELCSPDTTIGKIALAIREAAPRVTKQVVHDSYSLLQGVHDYSQLKYAFMRMDGLDLMITNMMLLPAALLSFGNANGQVFGNEGVPEAVRPLMDGFNSAWRMNMILPMRQNGGIDLLLGLFPEELDKLMEDDEFLKYAIRIG